MRKIITLITITLILFILDNSLIPFISIKGFLPSLVFVFIIGYSIINGSWEGLWLGVFAGLLQDIYFGNFFGINAFVNLISCALAGFIGKNIFRQKTIIPILSEFLLSIFKGLVIFAIFYFAKKDIRIKTIIFNGIYNMVISIIVYKYIYKLCGKEYMQVKWKF